MKKVWFLIVCLLLSGPVYADFKVHTGTFTLNQSTGNQSITGVGFEPKLVLLTSARTTSTSLTSNIQFIFGALSDDGQFSWVTAEDSAVATSNVKRMFKSTACLTAHGAGGTHQFTAEYVSLDSDGFTINITKGDSQSNLVAYQAYGGTDISNVKVGTFPVVTASGQTSVEGVGFEPDILIVTSNAAEADNTLEDQGGSSIGFATSASTQMTVSAGAVDAQAASVTDRYISSTTFISYAYNSALNNEAELVSMDSDGFTYDNTTAPGTEQIWGYIALNGSYSVDVITWQDKGTVGNNYISGLGYRPKAVVNANNGQAAYGLGDDYVFNIGYASEYDNQFGVSATSNDGSDPTDCGRRLRLDLNFRLADGGQSLISNNDFVSFEDDGFILERLNDDVNDRYHIGVVFGDSDQETDVQLKAETGYFQITGTGDIEVDFTNTFEPKVVFIYGVSQTTLDSNSLNLIYSFGVSSGPGAEFVNTWFDDDGPTTIDSERRMSESYVGYSLWNGTARAQFSMKSMDSDGFTVNVSNYNSNEYFNYWALGGPAVENVWIGTLDLGTSSGNVSTTDPGFQPDCVIFHNQAISVLDTTQSSGIFSIGASDGTNEYQVSGGNKDAVGTSVANRYATDSAVATQIFDDAIDYTVSFVSMDTNGFTVNVDANAFNDLLAAVAIKGPQCYVGNFADAASLGLQTITGHGFKGKTTMFFSWLGGTTFSLGTSVGYSLGTAVNSTERVGINIDVADNRTTSESHRFHMDDTLFMRRGSTDWNTLVAEIDFHSFTDDGFRVDIDAEDGTSRSIGYIVFGDAEPSVASSGANINKVIFIN